jgi:group I intron endonuclease
MSIPFSAFTESMNFVKIYSNFYEKRPLTSRGLKEGISGVYLFFNHITGSFYVGSSRNIYSRINNYLNQSYLLTHANKNQLICRAFLKYGHSNFAFLIIEYCSINDLKSRETFWISKLEPYYNVLTQAYDSSGFKHS